MYLTRLELKNWGPYYGEQVVDLKDTVYAVQAELEGDQGRSNWLGKSWFLGAIRFLLTGVKPKDAVHEDGWISWGEKDGWVKGTLSDGTRIERTRSRGKSTQLVLRVPGKEEARQDRAQEGIETLIGMNGKDLLATSLMLQGTISQVVKMDPADRTEMINGWMQLGPLEAAEDWTRAELQAVLTEIKELPTEPEHVDVDALTKELEGYKSEQAKKAAERDALLAQQEELEAWRRHKANAERLAQVRIEGKAARARHDSIKIPKGDLDTLEANVVSLTERRARASSRFRDLEEVFLGNWAGTCPLTCSECPVADQVRKTGQKMEAERHQAEAEADAADAELEEGRAKLKAQQQRARDKETAAEQLERLRAEGIALLPSEQYIEEHGDPPEGETLAIRLRPLDDALAVLFRQVAQAELLLKNAQAARAKAKEAEAQREELRADAATLAEAIAVLKGAYREVAEGTLAEISKGANALLKAAGIDLTVEVSWAREGRGLAKHCGTCGSAFPKSQAVKVCPVCEAPRGPLEVERLDVVPSDRSGAADDIAGMCYQLATSTWLRKRRGSPWAVTCIDEPFGALDLSNRKALSSHLHAMIRGSYAFQQGFIVAHDPAIMEALPARVVVVGLAEGGSRLEVR